MRRPSAAIRLLVAAPTSLRRTSRRAWPRAQICRELRRLRISGERCDAIQVDRGFFHLALHPRQLRQTKQRSGIIEPPFECHQEILFSFRQIVFCKIGVAQNHQQRRGNRSRGSLLLDEADALVKTALRKSSSASFSVASAFSGSSASTSLSCRIDFSGARLRR